ncbi:hypothetical protein [Streptomyces capitiformicae]|nr:hypothetical protein [Streptomyces capitiformicae]
MADVDDRSPRQRGAEDRGTGPEKGQGTGQETAGREAGQGAGPKTHPDTRPDTRPGTDLETDQDGDAARRRRRAQFLRELTEARELRDRVQPRRAKAARLRHALRMRTFRW